MKNPKNKTALRIAALGLLASFALLARYTFAQEHEAPANANEEAAPAGHETGHAPPAHEPLEHRPPDGLRGHEGPAVGGHEAAEQDTGEEHEAAGHEGHHGPEPMNWTDLSDKKRPAFIALLVNFGLLMALYYTLGKKPVAEGLRQRRISIGKDIDDARKMLEEAKERAKKYQADLKNADVDGATAREALVAAGKGEVERLIAEAEERGERMTRDAGRLVEQERKQLRQDLHIETVNLAVVEAQKLLERGTTPDDHTRLANELLAELQAKPAAARGSIARSST